MSDLCIVALTDEGEKQLHELRKARREGRYSESEYNAELATLAREGHVRLMKATEVAVQ
jgi:hypothetical protein